MNHLEVLQEVERRGLQLTASGQDLRLRGPQQRVDAALVTAIKEVKADLLAHLAQAGADGAPDQAPAGFPVTLLQRGYLVGRGGSVEMGNVASHIYHEIDGHWDIGRLEAALSAVVGRHGMLRTRFTADGRQVTEPAGRAAIGRLDLRGLPAAEQQARLAELREQRSHRILPADQAPLLAADVTLLADDRMRLHVGHDGLVMDAISMFAFFAEWWHAYSASPEGSAGPDQGDVVPFAEYVASLAAIRGSAAARRSRDYWLARLADLPARPDLPLATSPAAITAPRLTQHTVRLEAGDWAALKARAASAGVTPTVALLTAYAEVLARWGAGNRFTLATTVAVRPPIHPRIAEAIGNFSETLLIEIARDRQATFADRARAVQARLRSDLDHRHFSGIEVLRELARRDPGADARMPFTFNSAIGQAGPDGSALELFGPEVYTSSQTPQVWVNGFAFEQHGGLVVQFDEVDGLFPDGLIAAAAGAYDRLLHALAGEEAWARATFDLLPADQRERRRAANDTSGAVPGHLLPAAFAAQAGRTPDAPAVLSAGRTLTYRELFARAAAAARWLRARGTGRDELVGLVMRRGPGQVVGIMAALMAGGAYLPVDASSPAERIRYMLADGQVRSVLTNAAWRPGAALPPDAAASTAAPDGPASAGLPDVLDIDLGVPATEAGADFAWAPLPGATADDLAYVLYTSGTTGEPKGVMVSHRSVANVVADCADRFGIGPDDRFMAVSAFNFDLSAWDVFGALSAGAALVMPDADRATDPVHWLELCDRFGVTVWNSVPALPRLLAEEAGDGDPRLRALRLVMMSGDRIPAPLPSQLWRVAPGLRLMSLGGPTETTIWNICYPIGHGPADDGTGERIPYGRANANNRNYVLDADGQDAPDWVSGEICAAGTGLARGYWADEARTAERFVHDERLGERIYRTGDLGRFLPDGNIDILGRSDFQIKVNGYRIEAGEVEARLTQIADVKLAVVVRQAAREGDRLVAHLVPAGDTRPGPDEIRRTLGQHLPPYMTPSAIVWHDSLPLTRNGKVDRARLTALAADQPAGAGPATAPGGAPPGEHGELERQVAGLWAAVLRVDAAGIGPGTDFYDLGGDSLAAARIFTAVRKQFGVGLTLDQLHQVRTTTAMAGAIAAAGARS